MTLRIWFCLMVLAFLVLNGCDYPERDDGIVISAYDQHLKDRFNRPWTRRCVVVSLKNREGTYSMCGKEFDGCDVGEIASKCWQSCFKK